MAEGKEQVKEEREKFSIVLFSGDYDRAMAAFILATTAAAENMDVAIFFTFWGLNFLKKGKFALNSKQSLPQKLLNIMNRKADRLSRFNMGGLGISMMKYLMKKNKVPTVDELMKMAKAMGVKFIACTTTLKVMGLEKENFSDIVDEFAGAATFLERAKNSKITLFI